MTHAKLSWLLPLAVVLLCGPAHAQQPQSAKEDKQAADAALKSKAIDLLETVADQIGTLQSAENRARLGSNIAASLWPFNEKRARSLLVSVETDINLGLQKTNQQERTAAHTRMVFLKLRMDTVERIAQQDPELALAFLQATETEPSLPSTETEAMRRDPYGVEEWQRTLEMRLAKQIGATKPEVALRMGRRSLARGFTEDLIVLLTQLEKKDRERASVLYKEIVLKLRDTELEPSSDAFQFGLDLARAFAPPAADEQTFRQLISMFVSAALANGCGDGKPEEGPWFCIQIGALLSHMQRIDPARAAKLERWKPEVWQSMYDPKSFEVVQERVQNGTVDEVMALIETYPHLEDHIVWRAINKAEQEGEIERARALVNEHLEDDVMRREISARLDLQQKWFSMSADQVAQSQADLHKIADVKERLELLLRLANRLGKSDRKSALKLLDQASEMTGTMKPGKEQTEAEIAVAVMYCLEKSDRGLDKMRTMLPKLNQLVDAAAKLEGYDSYNLRDGEWDMSNTGSIGSLLTVLSQNAAYFAWCDFDGAVIMAGHFERAEIRLMAQLKLAQAILAGPPKRFTSMPYISFH